MGAMSKYKVTHKPIDDMDHVIEDVDANAIRPIDAGNAHFLAFVWESSAADDVRLILPAGTVHRVEKVPSPGA